jgi:hypothetical protein
MIGKEEEHNEEEEVLVVTDRRKWNTDGSLRDGVTIEKEEPKPASTADVSANDILGTEPAAPQQPEPGPGAARAPRPEPEPEAEDDSEDEKNPASFINFLSTLVTNAAAALGAMPHPATGQKSVDLEAGKYWVDVLTMLREKTKGNLKSREETLLTNILSDLQLQFVNLNRAAEEKLKAQAAEKFSSKDILGG